MMKKILLGLSLLCLPLAVMADSLGVRVGIANWSYDVQGFARYQSANEADNIDVNDDLGYDNDSLRFYYVTLEHPVPVLPNIRISRTDIDTNAEGVLSSNFNYGNITFTVNEPVSSRVELKQTDITLYYQLLDNVVGLDLGLNAKQIDSQAAITGAVSGTEAADVSGWVPMLYAGASFDFPITGLGVSADGSYVTYDGSKFYDYSLRATYTTPWYLGVEAGYRSLRLDLDDFDGSYADIEFDGYFLGGYLQF